MKRRKFIRNGVYALGSSALASHLSTHSEAAAAERPNIIFILSDDQRWDTLGCAGNPIIETPELDRLAEEGVRYSNAFVSSPACAPNRACLFTGLYERSHSYTFGSPPLKKAYSDISYPMRLKQAGYKTGYVGKSNVKFEPGVIGEMFDSFVPLGRKPYIREENGEKRHLTEIMTDRSIEFIDSCTGDRPFCLSLSFHAPHAEDDDPAQFIWPQACDGMYDNVTIPLPENAHLYNTMPGFMKTSFNRMRWWQRFCTPEKYQQMVKGYYRMISGIDREIGRLRKKLEESGMASNTVIIFMGDNGFFLGERGFGGKFMLYEQSLRVPLIVYDPRKDSTAGTVLDSMALNVDVAPTILSLAGIEPPGMMQGMNLELLAEENRHKARMGFLCEFLSTEFPSIIRSEGYRTEDLKYIRWIDSKNTIEELYDLAKDPLEENNLKNNASYASRLEGIRKRCDSEISRREGERH
ncbi:MAG: sulfatase [Candidatus Latescibacteria bacterium]|nr:sulfatase [Candidatus Latescibacterota bacterium]